MPKTPIGQLPEIKLFVVIIIKIFRFEFSRIEIQITDQSSEE